MKKFLRSVLLMACLAVPWATSGQETVTIGTGTSTNYYTPFNSLYGYSFTEMVYPAAAINMAGTITSISFHLGQSYSTAQTNTIALYMKNVSRTSFSSNTDYEAVTTSDLVYSGSWTIPASYTGWVTIQLDNPFYYDGSSNLMVAMHESTAGYATRNFTYTSATSACISFYSDGTNPDPYNIGSYSGSKTTRDYYGNIQLEITQDNLSCYPVRNLAVTGTVSTTELTVSWVDTNNSGASYNVYLINGTDTTLDGTTTDTSYIFSDLTANTTYTIGVQADCGSGDLASMRTIQARTLRVDPVSELPYTCGFEADEDTGWTVFNGTATNKWFIGSATNNGGSRSLYISNNNGTSNSYNIDYTSDVYAYRAFSLADDGDYALSFDWKGVGESTYDYLYAYIAPGSADFNGSSVSTTGWQNVSGLLNGSSTWQTAQIPLIGATAGTYYLVFYWHNDGSVGEQPPAAIDNISVSVINCSAPTALTVDTALTTETSVTLNWSGDASAYIVRANGGEWQDVSDTTYTFDNLSAGTGYTFVVAAVCGDDTSFSISTSTFTACGVITHTDGLPYVETFESYATGSTESINPCWTKYSFTTSTTYPYPSSTAGPNTPNSLYFYPTSSGTQWAVTPEFDEVDDLMVVFQMRSSSTAATTRMTVGVMGDPNDTTTFTPIESFGVSTTNTWELKECRLTSYTDTGRYIAFRAAGSSVNFYIDDITVMLAPSCERAQGVSVANLTSTTVDVVIHDSNQVNNYRIDVSGDSTFSVPASDTIYTLEDLQPNAQYTVTVVALCDDGNETSPVVTRFHTPCLPYATEDLPFMENFDSYTGGTSSSATTVFNPDCWTVIDRYGTYYPYVSTSQHNSGSNSLYFYTSSSKMTHMSMPAFEEDLENLELSFSVRVATSGYGVEVGVMSNPNDTSTFVPVDTCAPSATGTWEDFVIHFPGHTTGFIAFRNLNASAGTRTTYIDDINVHMAPTCERIEGFTVNNVTAYTADIHIDDPSTEGNYVIVASSATDTVTETATDTVYTISGLQPNTVYTFTVYTLCSDSSTTAPRVSPSYRTACAPIQQLPWTEDFDSYSSYYTSSGSMPGGMIPCWEFLPTASSDYMQFYNQTSSYSHNYELGTQGYSLKFYPGTSTSQAIVVMPAFEEEIGNLQLAFWTRPEGTGSSPGSLSVGYVTDATDRSSFVALETYSYSEFNGAYRMMIVTFPANAPEGSRIAFRHNTASSNWYWFIDDIYVSLAPSCARAQGIRAENIGATEADIVILDSNHVDNYTVTIVSGNDTVSEDVTDTILSLSNLTPNTQYSVSMVSVCDDGNTTYPFEMTFKTLCEGIEHDSLPWTENFNSYTGNTSSYESNRMDPDCWTILDRYGANYPYYNNSSTYSPNGGNCVYSYTSNNIKPVMVLPPFQDTPDQLMLSFDLYVSGSGNTVEVGIITNPNDATTFVPVTSFAPTTYSVWQHYEATFAGQTEGLIALRHTSGTVYIDNMVVDELPSCVAPSSVTVTDIDSANATITIADANNTGHYMLYIGTTDSVELFDNTYTFDTLTPGTDYTVSVRTICADGSMTDAAVASFRTDCAFITVLPWTEGFEGYTATTDIQADLNCWNTVKGSSSKFYVINDAARVHGGSNSLRFNGYATTPLMAILPPFADDISTLELSFWALAENGTTAGVLRIGYVTDVTDSSTFVLTALLNGADHTTYTQENVTFAGAPEGARIAIQQVNGNNNYWWWIDDIDVHIAPICARPQGVTVSNITSTTADVTISDSTLVGSYMYIITDGTNSDTVTNISDTIISLTDLQPGTYYDINVAAVCSDGNPTAFVNTTFLTECAPIATLPWSENFEGWGTGNAGFHPCWSHFYTSGSSTYTNSYPYVSTSASAHSGTKYMYNYTYQGSSSQYYSVFYLPEFEADLNTLGVSFFFKPNSSSYANTVRVAVGVSDSATADTSTFTRLATIAATQNAWEDFDADLSAYTGNGGRITFVVYGTTANYIYPYIDDITVDALADCRRPSVVEAVNITNNEATISWVDATLAGSYIVTLYDATGAAIGSPVTVTDTFYTFTGLTNATTYTVGVSSNCTNEATRERTMSFTTANCALLTRADLPLVETFDSYTTGTSGTIDNCWNKFSLSGTSYYPYPSSSYHHGTTGNSMYFYPYGVNRANYLVLPGYDTVANLNLRFWMYRGNSYAQIEVGVMTDPNNANTFTPIQAFTPSATSTWEEVDVDLNGYTGIGHFVALRAYCVNTTTNYSIYVDDITLSTISACPRPGSVSVSSATLNSAVVTVNDLAEINNYRLWWGDNDSVDITTNTYTITGLSASSSYTVTVAAICPDGTLTNTRSTTFRTLCGDITYSGLPWFESFETYGSNVRDTAAALSCWSFIHPHGETTYSSNGYCYVTNSYPVTGTYTLRFSGYAATPMVAVLPSFETDIANLKMTFHLRSENTNDYSDTTNSPGAIRVGYITDPTDSTTFVQTARFECTSGLYTNMTLDSATFAGAPTGARIAIEQVNNNTNYWWWIDDITVSLDQNTPTPQYTVSVSSADATMGTASCTPSGSVDAGTSVTATATANDGYHFVSWTDANGGTVSTANPYTFTVTADVALTATFEANSTPTYYTVTVSSADATMGTVSCTPSGSVEAGTSVTATATPANNHIFTGWVDANGDTVSRANPYTFTVTADVTLVGTFRYDGVGIDEAEVSNVSLFPNPATSTFTVSATGMKEATVIDLNGRTVMTQNAADGTATFDVSTLAKGTYFVRIVGEQATAVRKLVVK